MSNWLKYSILWLFLIASNSFFASAQVIPDKEPNEISIYLGGGLSSIHHQQMPHVPFFNGSVIEFGIGNTHYFNRKWGIYAGVGPAIYNTKKRVDVDVVTPGLTDAQGYTFNLYSTTDYSEAFQIMFVNIPIMLQYQTRHNYLTWRQRTKSYYGFYFMGGIKVSIPINDTYQSEVMSLTNAAYYPELDNWAATQNFAGLGTFDAGSITEGSLSFDIGVNLALEAGFKWRVGDNVMLYTGAFCNFGLSNSVKDTRPPVRNTIAVNYITDFPILSFSDNVNIAAAGIILRLSFYRSQDRSKCPYKKVIVRKQ